MRLFFDAWEFRPGRWAVTTREESIDQRTRHHTIHIYTHIVAQNQFFTFVDKIKILFEESMYVVLVYLPCSIVLYQLHNHIYLGKYTT